MKDLGRKIRKERKALGLTLEGFSELLQTSKATLQRIETGSKSPSVALLAEISHICRKPIEYFVHEERKDFFFLERSSQKAIVKKDSRITIISPYGLISKDMIVNHFEGMPGAHDEPHRDEGYEWIYVLEGTCMFEHDGIPYELKEGDVIYYDATKLHSYKILTPFKSIRISVRA
jgi:transcriptional regulator with XRE-family HTH domain